MLYTFYTDKDRLGGQTPAQNHGALVSGYVSVAMSTCCGVADISWKCPYQTFVAFAPLCEILHPTGRLGVRHPSMGRKR